MPIRPFFSYLLFGSSLAFGLSTSTPHFRNVTTPTYSTNTSSHFRNTTTPTHPHISSSFTNETTPTHSANASSATSMCSFVVQDVVSEYWWDYPQQETFVQVETVTSISKLVTTFVDSTITKHLTHLHTTDETFFFTMTDASNPFSLKFDNAPQPSQFTDILPGSQIVTAGTTVQYPAPFWVYSSVKIITVPAVTDSLGNLVCTTTSHGTITQSETKIPLSTATTTLTAANGMIVVTTKTIHTTEFYSKEKLDIYTISGVNSNAEAYFGGYGIAGWFSLGYGAESHVVEPPKTLTNSLGFTATIPPHTIHHVDPIYHWSRSNGNVFTYQPSTTGIVVTFSTPFVYLPSCRTDDGSEIEPICTHANRNEAYGYVPQAVLDYMISDSAIRSKYPGIASCLAGGPSIIIQNPPEFNPAYQTHPGHHDHLSKTKSPDPITTSLVTEAQSSNLQSAQPNGTPAQPTAAPSTDPTPPGNAPMSIPGTTTVIGDATFALIPPTTIPVNPAFPLIGSTITNGDGTFVIIASSTTVAIPSTLPSEVDTSLPSNPEIPTLPGSTIVLTGDTTAVVLSPGATVPLNPAYSVEGRTQVINGVTEVVLAASTTLEFPSNIPTIPSLPDITTVFPDGVTGVILPAEATIPVDPGYFVNGHTTVIDGTTEVILPVATTLVLSPQRDPVLASLPGITTVLPGGETEVILPSGATIPVDEGLSLSGFTTVINGKTEVILTTPETIPIETKKPQASKTKTLQQGGTFKTTNSAKENSKNAATSSSTEAVVTGASTPTAASPTGSLASANKHNSGSAAILIDMKFEVATWVVICLIWSVLA